MSDSSPLLPIGDKDVAPTEPGSPLISWIRTFFMFAMQAANILILLPYFQGYQCPAIPSAFAFAVTFSIFGVLRSPISLVHNVKRMRRGMKPSMDFTVQEDGEIYAGHKMICNIDQVLGVGTLVLGVFWGLPLTVMNRNVVEDNPEMCDASVYILILITSIITTAITGLIVVAIIVFGCKEMMKKK